VIATGFFLATIVIMIASLASDISGMADRGMRHDAVSIRNLLQVLGAENIDGLCDLRRDSHIPLSGALRHLIFVKLGILAGVAEVRLVEHRGVRRVVLGTGVNAAGKVHLRLAVGDRDRDLGEPSWLVAGQHFAGRHIG
jgi:hypothetical protein